jgi:hypothetical protein
MNTFWLVKLNLFLCCVSFLKQYFEFWWFFRIVGEMCYNTYLQKVRYEPWRKLPRDFISISGFVGKHFTSFINSRLLKWCERNDILTDAQFGFRPILGTTDAILALPSLIYNILRKGKRLYCCFIDYIKAFDSVSHVKIWLPLVRSGITGKLLKVIKSMYSKLISCVRLYGNYIHIFTCNVELMQMESLFPVLYSFYVNDIEFELINHGVSLMN